MAGSTIANNNNNNSDAPRMDVADLRAELTDKYSTKRFAMEYGGYLSNHLLHGAVALFELGASREQIEAFAEHYAAEKLEAVAPDLADPFHVEPVGASESDGATPVPSAQRLDALLGQREDFDALLAFYAREVRALGADAAVRAHLPRLVAGLCGALLHGLIQLGYAYRLGGDRLIAEGLAYLHFSYLSFEADTESDAESSSEPATRAFTRDEALRAVHALNGHELFLREMRAQLASAAVSALPLGLFQRKLNAVSAHPARGSRAAFGAVRSALASLDLSAFRGDEAIDFALWLYAMIEHSDFVITHAVTSAWALQQLEHLLDARDRERAWRVWLHVAASAFVLQEVRDLRADDVCANASAELPALASWDELSARAVALEGHPDEHVYKLVQVAREHALGGGKARSSFLSPEERDFVARKAATKVLSMPFEQI